MRKIKNSFNVTFETKCWEGDWEYMLKTDRLSKMVEKNRIEFYEKNLIINNVEKRNEVEKSAKEAVNKGAIDHYYFVEDYETQVLEHFKISSTFKKDKGYKYTISELVGAYLSRGDYLLHYSSDSIQVSEGNWIEQAIRMVEENQSIKAVSPAEDRRVARIISKNQNGLLTTQVFSDQCYLVPTVLFKQPIYSEFNEKANMYVEYGGELFEKRVGTYFMNHNLFRAVLGDSFYYSMNFSNLQLLKRFLVWTGKDFSVFFSYIADFKRFISRLRGK